MAQKKNATKYEIISKGAPEEILKRSKYYESKEKISKIDKKILKKINEEYDKLSSEGYRIVAVAHKTVNKKKSYDENDETDLILSGYLAFHDPPKHSTKDAIGALKDLGVDVKILTGDNELVTRKTCADVGIEIKGLMSGDEIHSMDDHQLMKKIEQNNIFVRMNPIQKERVIYLLKKNGHTVGFLGDGINDAATLKMADVGISVNNGVDIAKESASIILLNKDLMVLKEGVAEGRMVFSNLTKYIRMGSSSNFGNMFSIAAASIFLPFLPMLPIQIILNNFLYDLSQFAIPTDNVDPEYIKKPRPWNIDSIKKFMLTIGPVSSLFDIITFIVLLSIFGSSESMFQTGWFIESLLSQVMIIHIIRTKKRPFFESWSSRILIITSILIAVSGLLIALTPIGGIFGFTPLPMTYLLAIAAIVAAYMIMTYYVKKIIMEKFNID